jgi:hypothetical protein
MPPVASPAAPVASPAAPVASPAAPVASPAAPVAPPLAPAAPPLPPPPEPAAPEEQLHAENVPFFWHVLIPPGLPAPHGHATTALGAHVPPESEHAT